MDSLRPSLSQALPVHGHGHDSEAGEDLQQHFRVAAMSIATLYRKASESGRRAYQQGYSAGLQDVLEYLQAGLDEENHSSRRQGSEARMALTIERVMDYIERRQEALRGDGESGDEDLPHLAHGHVVQPGPSDNSLCSAPRSGPRPQDPAPRRQSPRRPTATDHQTRQSPVPSSPVLPLTAPSQVQQMGPSFELPISFPFNFEPFFPNTGIPRDRHSHRRAGPSNRRAKARDRERDRSSPGDTAPPNSNSLVAVPTAAGYTHYGHATDAEGQGGGVAPGKRRFAVPAVEELVGEEGNKDPDAVMVEGERASKRAARR